MGYANPIEAMGADAFADRAPRRPASTACWSSTIRRRKREAFAALLGARGHRPDLPAVADHAPRRASQRSRALARGYLYYVSLKGVTGAGHLDVAEVRAQARRRSGATIALPVGVGFGIRDAASARAIARGSPTRW